MSQPAYLVGGRVCPNQFIWSVEHISCPKFVRDWGVSRGWENVPSFELYIFFMASQRGPICVCILCDCTIFQLSKYRMPPPWNPFEPHHVPYGPFQILFWKCLINNFPILHTIFTHLSFINMTLMSFRKC
jgi:hypothetical protein